MRVSVCVRVRDITVHWTTVQQGHARQCTTVIDTAPLLLHQTSRLDTKKSTFEKRLEFTVVLSACDTSCVGTSFLPNSLLPTMKEPKCNICHRQVRIVDHVASVRSFCFRSCFYFLISQGGGGVQHGKSCKRLVTHKDVTQTREDRRYLSIW